MSNTFSSRSKNVIPANPGTKKPTSYQGDLHNLPQALKQLKALPNWVCWRWAHDDKGKWTKQPYQPKAPNRLARNNDPTTWGTYKEAIAAFKADRCDGIGFVLLNSDLAAFDLDDCRDIATGAIAPEARRIVDEAASYTEITVSGTGLRVIGLGDGTVTHRNQRLPDSTVSVESYSNTARFIVITGKPLLGACPNIRDISGHMTKLVKELDSTKQETVLSFDKAVAEKNLPQKLLDLIANPPANGDRSEDFHRVVNSLGELGYRPDRIARIIEGQPIVPGRYNKRLQQEIERSLGKDKPTQTKPKDGLSVDDFRAYMPMHKYIFVPDGSLWPSSGVNARIPPIMIGDRGMPANQWLDQNKPVEQMTWAPGLPQIITGRLIADGGWIEHSGVSCFNLYRPPTIKPGNATNAKPWLDHVYKVYGDDAHHIIQWLAHRVQRPGEKINHALVLGGEQGIGKDTLLEPVKWAVGPWNFREVAPSQVTDKFNPYLKSTILRISEARDHGEHDRYTFYDHTKTMMASPPDVLMVNDKHIRHYNVPNVCGVVLTTNHKTDGIYLPPDDRRHFVAWSPLSKTDFEPEYWNGLWDWYGKGGIADVAAYLAELDISDFDPKAPPPKTMAFWEIADANRAPEDAELADVLDLIGNPDAVTLDQLKASAHDETLEWLQDRKIRRAIPHRLERCGYVPIRNGAAKDGYWVVNYKRQPIYAKKSLSVRDQIAAANRLADR
jgi:hypothetical protein